MLVTERQSLREDVARWVERLGRQRSSLIPVLQEVQRAYGQISEFAMQQVAHELDIHPVEVYGVVSFYSFLSERTQGRFVVRLCRTISCDMQGKDRLARQLENDLGIRFGESTADGKFSLEWANCLGMCDRGPALLVNDQVFTSVTCEAAHAILETCRRSFGPLAFSATGEEARS